MPNGDLQEHSQIWDVINKMRERLATLEACIDNMQSSAPTQTQITDLKVELARTSESLKQFAMDKESVATKADVRWLVWWVRIEAGGLTGLAIAIATYALTHH